MTNTIDSAGRAELAGPADTLREEVAAAAEVARHARSARTRRIYGTAWRAFVAWCEARGLSALPASGATVAVYLAHLANTGRKVATVESALSAISSAHREAGMGSPRGTREVRAVIAGLRRTRDTTPRQVAPLTLAELRLVLSQIPDTLIGKRDRALILLGLACGLRRSELAAAQVEELESVDGGHGGMRLRIPRSKTDPEGNGAIVGVPVGVNAITCPIAAVNAWRSAAGIDAGPLFREVRKGGARLVAPRPERDAEGAPTGRMIGISGAAVAEVIKRRVEAAGLDPARFSGHSLRAGMATTAHQAGRSPIAIAKAGRWRSVEMVARYVREDPNKTAVLAGLL